MGVITPDIAFGLSAALIAGLMAHACCEVVIRQRLALDQVSDRSNHQVPTPRLGGAAILIGLGAGAAIMMAASLISPDHIPLMMLTLAAGAVGLADDLTELSAGAKLVMLSIIAGLASVVLGPIQQMPVPFAGWVALPSTVGLALGAFWLLAVMNVVNFMDGLNGLIGTAVVLVLCNIGLFAAGDLGWLILAVQAAVLGFLFCNVFRGRIFLGDAGSLSLGFLLGAVPLLTQGEGRGFWLTPLVILPLIGDVAVTLVRRGLRGAPLSEPHREHLYQRLKAVGWSHQAVALSLGLLAVVAVWLIHAVGTGLDVTAMSYWGLAIVLGLLWAAVMIAMRVVKPTSREDV